MTGNADATQGPTAPFEDFVESPRGHQLRNDVKRIAGGNDGEDVVQEVLVWAWQRWDTFESEDHVVFACIRFARNRVVDRARRPDQRRVDLRESFDAHALGVATDPADAMVRLDDCRDRWRVFRLLPATAQSLLLNRAEGATYDELAARFAMSPAASRVQVCRSRAAMRNALRPTALAAALMVPRWLFRKVRSGTAQVARGAGGGALGPVTSGATSLATTALLALPAPGVATAPSRVAEVHPVRSVSVVEVVPEPTVEPVASRRDVREPAPPQREECRRHCKKTAVDEAREVAGGALDRAGDLTCVAALDAAPDVEAGDVATWADGSMYYEVQVRVQGSVADSCDPGLTVAVTITDESPGSGDRELKSGDGDDRAVWVTDTMPMPFDIARTASFLRVRVHFVHDAYATESCVDYRYVVVATSTDVDVSDPDASDCDPSVWTVHNGA